MLELERTEDILAYIGAHKQPGQFICGFSMETENMLENSITKLVKKNLDMVIANNLKVEGAGFGVNGDSHYGASGEYIKIRVAIAADGKIVDCYTVYQSETNGFGSVCADEEFYGQFAGKTESDYKDIIIAGSTYTTDGYHGAIKNAFKAVAIFEGGAN